MPRLPFTAAACGLLLSLGLGGCAYDDGYGYGGVDVGYGSYYGPDYYGPGGYGYGGYGGWYDGFYYPGSGYYVYDRGGSRHRWNDRQRSYWQGRHREWRGDRDGRPNDGVPGNNGWRGRPGDGNHDRNSPRPGWNGQAGANQSGNGQSGNGQPGTGAIRSRQDWEANRQRQWRQQGQGAVQQPAPSANRQGWDATRGAVINRPTPNLRSEGQGDRPRGDGGRGTRRGHGN
ncbi:peptidase [Sphingobium aquiterrae]|uniref:peptidase n=1 Tax=Sphingobium aquiterrae TaxID=2038656 RepID=UPI003019B600